MWFLQLWRLRWGSTGVVPPPALVVVPDPTRLAPLDDLSTQLEVVDATATFLEPETIATRLEWISSEGEAMAQPLIFTAGETGDLAFACIGADGTRQDLTGATCTFRLVSADGTVYANAVSLTITTASEGVVTWDRLTAQVRDANDYVYQVKAILSDGTPKYFPSGQPGQAGNPLTIQPAV